MILKFNELSKNYKNVKALIDFDIEMQEGIYAILGPNGSGKSTMMNILAGLLIPSSGNIELDGLDIKSMDKEFRNILGYLPQNPGFYANFKAIDLMKYFAELKGIKDSKDKIDELLELVNLSDDVGKKYGSFSGGMKRRLGIAVALLNDPKILILDEPTAGLDPKERIRFRNIISKLSRNKIIIIATHIVSDVESIADKVVLLKKGLVVGYDSTSNIIKSIDGKVWQFRCDEATADKFVDEYKTATIEKDSDGLLVRVVSDKKPLVESVNVSPTLEDVYMYYFEKREE